mmetsp:Transcript_22507/g.58083  ORF Transcript_22507/g.58083 Transcript_22507/m.58083 type:complete len:205 (+) Transcript_22507:2059-2673(+)
MSATSGKLTAVPRPPSSWGVLVHARCTWCESADAPSTYRGERRVRWGGVRRYFGDSVSVREGQCGCGSGGGSGSGSGGEHDVSLESDLHPAPSFARSLSVPHLHALSLELRRLLRESENLSGAHEGEVERVEKQHNPLAGLGVLRERDLLEVITDHGLGLEIGGLVADHEARGRGRQGEKAHKLHHHRDKRWETCQETSTLRGR